MISQNTEQKACIICLNEEIGFTCINCSQSVCESCLFSWALEQVSSSFSFNLLKCFSCGCQKQSLLTEIMANLSSEKGEQLNLLALKKYVSSEQDCIECLKCKDIGFSLSADDGNSERNIRSPSCGQLICRNCNTPLDSDMKEESKVYELFSWMYEIFLTDPCPNCGVKIQKIGGCSTMECKKCDFKFCWYCKKQGEANHNRKLCIGHQAAKWLIYSNILTNIILILDLHLFIASIIQAILTAIGNIFLGSFLVKFFFYNLLMIFAGTTAIGIKNTIQIILKIIAQNREGVFSENHYKKRRKLIKKTLFTFGMTLAELLIIDFNDSFEDMIYFLGSQIMYIGGFIACYATIKVVPYYIKQRQKSYKPQSERVFSYSYQEWLSKLSKK